MEGPERPGSKIGSSPDQPMRSGSSMGERSPAEVVLDHAALSHQLSMKVYALRAAHESREDIASPLADLQHLISTDLESYVRSLVGVLRSDKERPGKRAELRWLPRGAARRHERQHRQLLEAFATFEQMTMGGSVVPADPHARQSVPVVHYTYTTHHKDSVTPTEIVRQAVFIQKLWNTHVADEDAHFMRTAGQPRAAGVGEHSDAEARVVLGAHLLAELVDQHSQLAGLVAVAKSHLGGPRDLVPFARATAALSSHASLVTVRLYPAINAALPDTRAETERWSWSIFEAARTMLKVESALGGDARALRHSVPELIAQVEVLLAQHAADDEAVISRFSAAASVEELSRLLGLMRPGLAHAQTRPHLAAQSGSLLGKAAATLHRRYDKILDTLDSRGT